MHYEHQVYVPLTSLTVMSNITLITVAPEEKVCVLLNNFVVKPYIYTGRISMKDLYKYSHVYTDHRYI